MCLDIIGTPSLKSYRTATTLCVPDLVFNDISRHKILLPEGTPVQREILAGMSSADEQFYVAGHAVQNSNVDYCFCTLLTVRFKCKFLQCWFRQRIYWALRLALFKFDCQCANLWLYSCI